MIHVIIKASWHTIPNFFNAYTCINCSEMLFFFFLIYLLHLDFMLTREHCTLRYSSRHKLKMAENWWSLKERLPTRLLLVVRPGKCYSSWNECTFIHRLKCLDISIFSVWQWKTYSWHPSSFIFIMLQILRTALLGKKCLHLACSERANNFIYLFTYMIDFALIAKPLWAAKLKFGR